MNGDGDPLSKGQPSSQLPLLHFTQALILFGSRSDINPLVFQKAARCDVMLPLSVLLGERNLQLIRPRAFIIVKVRKSGWWHKNIYMVLWIKKNQNQIEILKVLYTKKNAQGPIAFLKQYTLIPLLNFVLLNVHYIYSQLLYFVFNIYIGILND